MPKVSLPSGVRKAKPYGGSPPAHLLQEINANGAHKEESPGGWSDHSHCPWLSRLSRRVSRTSVTSLTAVGIEHAHIHAASDNGSRAFRKANITGAHHGDQRAASGRDHEPGACYCRGTGTVKVRGVLESGNSQTGTRDPQAGPIAVYRAA